MHANDATLAQLPPPVICLILFGAPHRGLNIVALQSMVRGVHAFRRTCPGTRNAISDLTDAQPRLFWTSSQLHRSDGKNLSTLKLGTCGTSRFRRERPAHAAMLVMPLLPLELGIGGMAILIGVL